MYLNKVVLIGNLTRDPELKAMPSGTKVCNFSLATNSSYKDRDGKKVDSVEYHNIVVYGVIAENCSKYIKKGQQVLVEGKIATRSWDKQDGSKAYKVEIIAQTVQFGMKPGQNGTKTQEPTIDAETGQERPAAKPKASQAPAILVPGAVRQSDDQIEYPVEEINPDDIPF